MPILAVVLPILLAAAIYGGLRMGILLDLARRPLAVTGVALAVGVIWRFAGLPQPPDQIVRILVQALLGTLVFGAALECRLSRLWHISPDAFRLAAGASMLTMLGVAATAFVFVPGLGLYPPLLIGAALMLGGAPMLAGQLLSAPVDDHTRTAARVEAAAVLAIGVPIAIMIGAGAKPTLGAGSIFAWATIKALLGFGLGGLAGLLAPRFIKVGDGELPLGPLMLAAGVYFLAVLLRVDPVMAMAGAGLTFSAGAHIPAATRTRYWRTGELVLGAPALILFGLFVAPMAVTFDFLVWFMAFVAVGLVRALARHLILSTSHLPIADRTFLIWFNGAPGVASALMLSLYVTGQAPIDERGVALAAAAILIGLVSARSISKPLTRRLIQQTALAKKQRYETSYSVFNHRAAS